MTKRAPGGSRRPPGWAIRPPCVIWACAMKPARGCPRTRP
jgi:hypothetical protein